MRICNTLILLSICIILEGAQGKTIRFREDRVITEYPSGVNDDTVEPEQIVIVQGEEPAAASNTTEAEDTIRKVTEEALKVEEEAQRREDEAKKYFHEPGWGQNTAQSHYDLRFYRRELSYDERRETQLHMLRAYLMTFEQKGLQTWIAHGTLLGWWWNGKVHHSFPTTSTL